MLDRRPGPTGAPEEPPNTSIFVRGLPADVSNEGLEGAFNRYGTIRHGVGGVQIKGVKGRDAIAFVEFEEIESMQAAIKGTTELGGCRVRLCLSVLDALAAVHLPLGHCSAVRGRQGARSPLSSLRSSSRCRPRSSVPPSWAAAE